MFFASATYAADPVPLPVFRFGIEGANSPKDVAVTLQIIFLITVLSVAPSILILMTSFTRIIIVFHS